MPHVYSDTKYYAKVLVGPKSDKFYLKLQAFNFFRYSLHIYINVLYEPLI